MVATHALITGMSGVGKTSVIESLRERGFAAFDVDEQGWYSYDAEGNQLWDEARIHKAIDTADEDFFLSGCAENQSRFYPQFTHIVLLSAPRETMLDRLANRTNNPFGKEERDLERIFEDMEAFEPLLRRGATHEIVTTIPMEDVVREVLVHCELISETEN